MNMYDLIRYSENDLQTSGSLWEYYRDQTGFNDDGKVIDFPVNDDTSLSFKYEKNAMGRTENYDIKITEIWIPLKYLSNFRRTLKIPLINCEVNLILTWSGNCILISGGTDNQLPTFGITDTKLHVPLVTLST